MALHNQTVRRVRLAFSLSLGLWLLACLPARAIVDAFSQSNTNPPTDGAPWGNVASVNGAGGTYLGFGWVLTPAHVGMGTAYFEAGAFPADGTWHQLTNSDGSVADLVLFHLSSAPPLPSLPLAARTPAAGTVVDIIGHGHVAGSAESSFGAYRGFAWSSFTAKSWGNNRVNSGGLTKVNAGSGDVTVFSSDFSSPGGLFGGNATSDEAQGSGGDSGGGVFGFNDTAWELVGLVNAIQNLVSQPDSTSVYGDVTYYGDIATYRSQILPYLQSSAVPNLAIQRVGSDLMVSWPDTGTPYTLLTTSNLSTPNWQPVTAPTSTANGQTYVQFAPSGGPQFFRLSSASH